MGDKVLAIDQGTTGTTCLVVDMEPGAVKVAGRGYAEFPQHFPQPGRVEHELDEIWQSTLTSIAAALGAAGVKGSDVAAIGITNQRETTGLWDTSGQPVHRAIVWQDRRTAEHCRELEQAGRQDLIRSRTGLVIDPYFSGTKVAWLLNNVDGARERAQRGELRFGTMDTWLVFKLTSGTEHKTDATNAGRTMLYDIVKGIWDPELADLLGGVPSSLMPEVRSSSEVYGKTRGLEVLPDGIPIAGMAGDQHAALFGQACFAEGMAKCTYGTGAFALVNTGNQLVLSDNGLVSTIAWQLGSETTYAIEGSAFIAGAVVQWLRDGLGFIKESKEVEELAASVEDSHGVIVVPALTGLGAPHWRPDARGTITGLTRGTTRAHIARAALEGIAFQIYDLLDAMGQDRGEAVSVLRVDGGASANDLLMQFQADVLGVEIHRPTILDTTAMGAAYLAALGVGMFSGLDEVTKNWALDQTYTPTMGREHAKARIDQWRQAVAKA